MAEEDGLALWRSIMGDSDDDSDMPFCGFTLEEVVKGDESDIDLSVVRQQDLRKIFPTFHRCLQCQPVKLVVVKAILKCLLLLLENDAERLGRRPRRDGPRLRETGQRSGSLTKSVK